MLGAEEGGGEDHARFAYDDVIAMGIRRQYEPQIVGDLLKVEISEKQAHPIKYQLLTVARLPLAKDVEGFDFAGTSVNAWLVRKLATGGFPAECD